MYKNDAKGIVLLSGGIDSTVALAQWNDLIDIKLALTFDYGQKSFKKEFEASKKIAQFYDLEHEIVQLDWLKNITKTSLVSGDKVPDVKIEELDEKDVTKESKKRVWVPNRNGLFINAAAAYADALGYDYIIIGANKEEAATFPDNSKDFLDNINKALEYSTEKGVCTVAPTINMNKDEIVKAGVYLKAPLEFINSCYNNTEKHCGKCESCNRLKRALQNNNQNELLKVLFEN